MNENSLVIHSPQISLLGKSSKILKNGSQVLVRVIEYKGDGKYTGSVAGTRVNLFSKSPLKIGTSFIAKISSKNGSVFVTPQKMVDVKPENIQFKSISDNQIFLILEKMGLPVDNLSLRLFQIVRQLEMKIEPEFLRRLYNTSLKFKGKEKTAAELLLLLEQKGIKADFDDILEFLAFLENGEASGKKDNSKNFEKVRQFINRINKKEGLWYIFSFDLLHSSEKKIENNIVGSGCIKILLDKNNSIKMLNFNCDYDGQSYFFNLFYENKKIKKIKFFVNNNLLENEKKLLLSLQEKLLKINNQIEISLLKKEEVVNFFSDDEVFYSFSGAV